MQTWLLKPIDTLFFKEARPMEGPGTVELASVFPPPPRTIMGALRTRIGDSMGVNWKKFDKKTNQDTLELKVKEIIGDGDDYADLAMQGVWIHNDNQRLFPAPLNIVQDKQKNPFQLLKIDTKTPYHCDLGKNVYLPIAKKGTKSLKECWVTKQGLEAILAGRPPAQNEVIKKDDLYQDEVRLGIEINHQTRAVEGGMLYQTRHLRFKENIFLSIDLKGDKDKLKQGLLKLGGEGRMIALEKSQQSFSFPQPPKKSQKTKGICLYLLTPMLLLENTEFLPSFKKIEENNKTIWKGEINKIPLHLISCMIAKVYREGGWNAAEHKPRAVQSFISAGSVFYCEVAEKDIKKALKALNNFQIGEEQYLGRGHLAAGLWEK